MILNNTPTLSASLCYWPFGLEVDFEATLYQFCKIMILTTRRGWGDFEKLSITFAYFVLPAITMGSLLLNNSPSDLLKYSFLGKLRKCGFEQQSVTLRMLTSNYLRKIGLQLF